MSKQIDTFNKLKYPQQVFEEVDRKLHEHTLSIRNYKNKDKDSFWNSYSKDRKLIIKECGWLSQEYEDEVVRRTIYAYQKNKS